MSDSTNSTEQYLDKLKKWGLYAAAAVAVAVTSAVLSRWLGTPVQLPPVPVGAVAQPPVVVVIGQPLPGQYGWFRDFDPEDRAKMQELLRTGKVTPIVTSPATTK